MSNRTWRVVTAAALVLAFVSGASAQTASGWKGTTSNDFQTATNWDNGFGNNFNLFVGQAWQDAGRTGSTTLNNAANYTGYRLTFQNISGGSNPNFTVQGNNLNLFDFGGNAPQVNNNSLVSQQVNTNVVFKSGAGSASVNATGANLTFGASVGATTGKIFLNNANNAFQFNVGGASGKTVTFNTTVVNNDGTAGLRTAVTGNEDVLFAGGLTGPGDFLKQGTGTATFATTLSTFGGTNAVFIDQGTVAVGTGGSLGTTNGTTTGLINMGSSSTAGLNSTAGIVNSAVTVANPFNIRFLQTGGKALSGTFTSSNSTYSGTISLADHASLNQATGGSLIFSGAISQAAGTLSATPGVGNVNNSVPQTGNSFNTDGTKGPGLLINSTGTAGVVEFDASNTFTGDTVIQAGTLQFALSGSSISTLRLGNSSGSAAATINIADGHAVAGTVNVRPGSNGLKTISGTNASPTTATYSGHIALDDNATFLSTNAGATLAFNQVHGIDSTTGFDIKNKVASFGGAGDFNVSGEVYETVAGGSVLKTGAGTLFLSFNTNTYTGGTTINNGIVKVNTTGGLGATTSNVTINGGTLEIAQAGASTSNKSYFLGNSGGTVQTDSGVSLTLGGVVANVAAQIGALTKTGSGTLVLNNTDTYSGNTNISAGTLALGASGSINNTPAISIAAGATFDVSAISAYVLNGSTSLSASGAGSGIGSTAATITGATSVSLASQPVSLVFTPTSFNGDTAHPSLLVSQDALTLNNNTISVNNAGASPLGPGTYRLIQVTSGTINGAPNAAVTVTGSGIVAGDTASLSVSGGNVNLEVRATPAFSNLTANQSITFGTSSVTLSGKLSAPGPIFPANGETITVTINGNPQATTINDATGDFSINYSSSTIPASITPYIVTYSYAGSGTFNPASDGSRTLTVNKAPQTINFGSLPTKTYGDVGFDPGATATSGLAVSYASSDTNVATVSGTTITIVGAGSTTVTASQSGNSNYNAAIDVPQTLTVDQKPLTVTGLTGDNKPYDGNNTATFSGTPALSGVVSGEEMDVVLGGSPSATFADKNAGTGKTITVTGFSKSGSAAGNYSLTQPTLTGNITAKGLDITADNKVKAKGDPDPSLTYTSNGLVSGDNISGSLTRAAGESPGTYAITQGSLDAGSNYLINFTAGQLVITGPVALADAATRLNNGTEITISVSALLANDYRVASDGSNQTDNLSLTAVTDGAGNHVVLSGGSITYRPTDPSISTPLTFTYTLSDGTSTDTGTVTVNTSGNATPLLKIISKTGPSYDLGTDTSTLIVNLAGVPNQSYAIDYSTDLSNWTPYANNPVDTTATGAFTVTITAPGNQTVNWRKMFFRANE